ncbi:phage holin family protein [Paenibacillus agilis]|uniref:Holin n=1 Tax=Paenibacillus agilis TaxID=3020863 RepID=A0A559IX76_9BACL|nr:phage holin family protein [Paenibacillus agilis]TVX92237.1 hypothetical protein FPZ44_03680 [Paenibacillus agilis]
MDHATIVNFTWGAVANYIDPTLIIVVLACWALGFALKRTPNVPNWSIIYIVTAVAVVLAVGLLGFTTAAIIQGILCGALAVYGHQLVKQTSKGGGSNADHSNGQ